MKETIKHLTYECRIHTCADGNQYQKRDYGFEVKYICRDLDSDKVFPIKFVFKNKDQFKGIDEKVKARLNKIDASKLWKSKKDDKILNDKVWLDKVEDRINNELLWVVKKVKDETGITSGQITNDFVEEFPASIFNKDTLFKFLKQLTNQPTWNDIRIYILNHNFEGVD